MKQQTKPKKSRSLFKKLIVGVLAAGVACALFTLAVNAYVISYAKQYILTPEEAQAQQSDCIMVLGAGVRGERATPILQDRLDTGIELYETGAADRLLMTGDHGRVEYDEVNTMKEIAVRAGVPSPHVFMDHAGFSTYESMVRADKVFRVESAIIVTQEYHLYRAVFLARKLGLEAYGVRADRRAYRNMRYYHVREYLARVKDATYVLFRPDPTYLGEEIPISGDGDVTNDRGT